MGAKNKNHFLYLLNKLNIVLGSIESFLMVIGGAVLVIAILIAIVCRYWLYIATPWSDELARFVFLWIAFIGMAYVTQKNSHIDVRLIDSLLASKSSEKDRLLKIIIKLSQLISFAVLIISAVLYGKFMFARYPSKSPSLHIPMRIPYLSTFVGLILMSIHEFILLILPSSLDNAKGSDK